MLEAHHVVEFEVSEEELVVEAKQYSLLRRGWQLLSPPPLANAILAFWGTSGSKAVTIDNHDVDADDDEHDDDAEAMNNLQTPETL